MAQNQKKKDIIKKFTKLCEKLHRVPTFAELEKQTGITKNMIQHHFHSMNELFNLAKAASPKTFVNNLHDLFNTDNANRLRKEVKKYNRFIITTAVAGCKVDEDFFKSIDVFCKFNKAMPLVLLAADPAAKATQKGFIDPLIPRDNIVVTHLQLNSNLHISTIKIAAKQIDPVTGLGRVGQRNGSFIYASPKQRLKFVAVGNNKEPHALMTTGALTKSDYRTNNFMSERTAFLADSDHTLGAIIVEIQDDRVFHFRQVQFLEGRFIDLGTEYTPAGHKEVGAEAMVLGDLHCGECDPTALAAWQEIVQLVKPKNIVLHDIFNGKTINHHEAKSVGEKAISLRAIATFEQEIRIVADQLMDIGSWCKTSKMVIVKSNHDEWIDKYLKQGEYVKDPINHGFALRLANALVNDDQDPLKYAVEFVEGSLKNKIKWLDRDEDFKIKGIQLGAHGDLGQNGSRGNIAAMEMSYGQSVSGHTHCPEILRGAFVTGTTSLLKLSYNRGASSWLHSSCLVYSNGGRQLINSIGGDWAL